MIIDKIQDLKVVKKLGERLQDVDVKEFWLEYKNEKQDSLKETLHTYQTVGGVPLWKINRVLNRLARKGLSKEMLEKGMITIKLPSINTGELMSDDDKSELVKKINQLEGFELLRLCEFYQYKTTYMERKIINHVTRWIEIEIKN
ncbi:MULTISPECIES: hypothetical protein [unclassified Bacillus (in: firmicutes)]|uniref:hypothetical protein n=1 Tax=unclassified Bacillus (in: firmicutes) TaxID=185979 RepID=UPI0008E79BEB|nr:MULTISPECIES: hypothetical protein [unclassified Bacillus (in: firmicutes)]SFA70214.1 hypothetical protein SAMN02799634_10194 [Bacillus sp. UNCCL13]SFQ59787.1 hypothetical protein SAMN04488577_0378 [Bacillus sp. cl95]